MFVIEHRTGRIALALFAISIGLAIQAWSFGAESVSGQGAFPDTVYAIAANSLKTWKRLASRNADLYDLRGMEADIETAKLTLAYTEYQLWNEDVTRYLASDKADPRSFSIWRIYVFIIQSGNDYLGALNVGRNVSRSGERFPHSKGEYGLWGFYLRSDSLTQKVVSVASTAAKDSLHVLGVVVFKQQNVPPYIVLGRKDGTYLLPTTRSGAITGSLIPISKGTELKSVIVGRQAQ